MVVQDDGHHVGAELVQQLLPQRVVHGTSAQVREADAVLLAREGHLVGGVYVLRDVVLLEHKAHRGSRLVPRRRREGARKVGATQLRDVGVHVVRHVVKAVLDGIARGGVRLEALLAKGELALVDDGVGVAPQTDGVASRVEHPAAGRHVPAGKIALAAAQLQLGRLAGRQLVGLGKRHQDGRALLHALPRGRHGIELGHVTACDLALVGHAHLGEKVLPLVRHVQELPLEARVREAEAKREGHRRVIVKSRVVARRGLCRPGLVVAVANVDALGVLHKVGARANGGVVVGHVRIGVVAKVVEARRGREVGRP